jgi:NADPH-dependent 2,4-dienoyl-CoA reductase/sulfur reductase-like enzyme
MRSQEVITARLPGKPGSCWTATAPKTAFPRLAGSQATDVVVVGAGIVGVTAACLLSHASLSVALLEAEEPDWASIYDPVRKVPRKFNQGGDSQSFVHNLDQIEPGGGGVMNLGRGKIAVLSMLMVAQ